MKPLQWRTFFSALMAWWPAVATTPWILDCSGRETSSDAGAPADHSMPAESATDEDGDSLGDSGVDSPSSPDSAAPSSPRGLHVVGNHIESAAGDTIVFRGVNRSGTEYRCVQGAGIFDGPSDESSIQAIAAWKINAVRLPLNESCWLGINGAPAIYSGDAYQSAIREYVGRLRKDGITPILELHWVSPGSTLASGQKPMPDADHAPDFWRSVAAMFSSDDGVVFEVFNEPSPDGNRDSPAAWQCWRDGCVSSAAGTSYQAAGMQSLVDAVRSTGAPNLVLLDGVQFANGLSQWSLYKPVDPIDNIAASWHVYNNNPCASVECWNGAPAQLAMAFPIVATEIGENDCMGTFITALMDWLDQRGAGYLAWTWNVGAACAPGINSYWLIADETGTPNGAYGQTFHDHLTNR